MEETIGKAGQGEEIKSSLPGNRWLEKSQKISSLGPDLPRQVSPKCANSLPWQEESQAHSSPGVVG